jgi:hypothetical protein
MHREDFMELDVWIDLEGNSGIDWKGGDWAKDMAIGKMPRGRSPFFPNGHEAFYKVRALIDSGKYENDYIDNLTRYVKVPKDEILKLIQSLHCNLEHINSRLSELEKFVETLPDDRLYKLITNEF